MDNIAIVLVATTHPGNIGATARAMKTMGLNELRLVKPKIYPGAEVTARAAGADDILASAQVYSDLKDALSDCSLVYGTSARSRSIQWPIHTPEYTAGRILLKSAQEEKCAIVFGRESSGLSNEEIDLCNAMVQIPSNPEYASLNLASAVQILCYELYKQNVQGCSGPQTALDDITFATNEQMEQLYQHLEKCLVDIGYYDPEKPRLLMRRLRRIYNRAQLEEDEYSILRGIIAATQEKLKK